MSLLKLGKAKIADIYNALEINYFQSNKLWRRFLINIVRATRRGNSAEIKNIRANRKLIRKLRVFNDRIK